MNALTASITRQSIWLAIVALLMLSLAIFPACAGAASLTDDMSTSSHSCDAPVEHPAACPRPGDMHPSADSVAATPPIIQSAAIFDPIPAARINSFESSPEFILNPESLRLIPLRI